MPGKKITSKFESEFIQMGRKKLEIFINRIERHPILSKSTIFQDFLYKNVNDIFKTKVNQNKPKNQTRVIPLDDLYDSCEVKEGDTAFIQQKIDNWNKLEPILKELYEESNKFLVLKEYFALSLVGLGQKIDMLRSVQTKIVYQDIYTFFYKQLLNMEQMYIEEMKCGHIPFESAIEDYIRLCDSVKTADNSKKNAINNYNNSIKVQQKCKSKYEKAKTTENKKNKTN